MARRRKPGPRTKSGRLSRAYKGPARDAGTEEAQAKRVALVGKNIKGEPNDPALAATAAGILYANGHLDRQQYDGALRLRSLHAVLYGTAWPKPSWGSGEISDEALIEMRDEYDGKVARLTVEQRAVLVNVCVFDAIPTWFFSRRIGLPWLPEDHAEHGLLVSGMDALLGRRAKLDKSEPPSVESKMQQVKYCLQPALP